MKKSNFKNFTGMPKFLYLLPDELFLFVLSFIFDYSKLVGHTLYF